MPGSKTSTDFYCIKEKTLRKLALEHFQYRKSVKTGFSSWAASLHQVVCYAKSMNSASDPHVAVIDTHQLDSEVLVWQCTHLTDDGDSNYQEEYLAWGRIRGKGYKVVPLKTILDSGVFDIFPDLRNGTYREGLFFEFGDGCCSTSFAKAPVPYTTQAHKTAEKIAGLFEHLYLPVFTALLCLEPRPGLAKTSASSSTVLSITMNAIDRAGAADVLNGIRLDDWLRPNKVDTRGFPDVRQWIALLHALVQHQIQRDLKKVPTHVCLVPATAGRADC